MLYAQFLRWAGKQGFKYGQKYLNTAWKEAIKGGKVVLESHFPKLLNKAKDYYKNFKGADLKPVKLKRFKWDPFPTERLRAKMLERVKAERLHAANAQRFVEGAKEGITGIKPPGFHPYVIKGGKKGWKPKKAQGGIAGLENGGDVQLASAPEGELFMHEEFLEAVKQGFRGTYDEYIDQIDRSPADYMGAAGGRVPMLAGGLLRTGIMEALYPLLKGSWKGTLGSYRELLKRIGKQEVRADVDKVMPTIKSSRAVNLAKSVREELLEKIKGYKEGFVGAIKSRKTGDQGEELKYLIKETKKDIKHIDDFILKKEAGVATKHAKGGRIGFDDGGSTQKEIDKALVAIEKLKPGLMPESYKALIELYKDKQKDLNIDIMESAGGLGEMLGEGGRIGFKKGTKKGGIGALMGELYRLFEIGPLLGSPELMDIIQNLPFEKGGRVGFKKGDKVDLDRRMILKGIASLAALPIVGKYFKWAKPLKDITVKIRKASWNEDVDYGTSGNVLFDFIGKSKVGRELIKKYLPKNYKKDWGMDPKDAYKIVKKAKDKGLNIKVTELADDATTVVKDGVINPKWYLGGRTLDRQTQQRLYNEAQKRFKKQTSRENIKDHLDDTQFFENDMYKWPKPNYTGTPTRYTDKIIDLIEPVVKKAAGGRIGAADGRFIDSVGIGPLNINPRFSITESEKGIGPEVDLKTGTTNIGADIMLDLPKDFYLKGEYDKGRASEDIYYQGKKVLENVPFDDDIWKYGIGIEKEGSRSELIYSPDTKKYGFKTGNEGFRAEVIYNPDNERYEFKLVKSFNEGGIARRPNAVPPLSGPMPQGLTFLLGDDIVKSRSA